jgi:hypothetical protein
LPIIYGGGREGIIIIESEVALPLHRKKRTAYNDPLMDEGSFYICNDEHFHTIVKKDRYFNR